jgi:hypothetical protein
VNLTHHNLYAILDSWHLYDNLDPELEPDADPELESALDTPQPVRQLDTRTCTTT